MKGDVRLLIKVLSNQQKTLPLTSAHGGFQWTNKLMPQSCRPVTKAVIKPEAAPEFSNNKSINRNLEPLSHGDNLLKLDVSICFAH